MNLPIYSENEYLLAVDRLALHVNNKDIFSVSKQNGGVGLTISKDLSKKMYRQSYYKKCLFKDANLMNIGFAGSKFIDTKFEDCIFSNGNLHSCTFKDVVFTSSSNKTNNLDNAGFHKSTFTNCTFENLFIYSSGFTETIFFRVKFINCTIRLCSLENAQFADCTFINVNMSTLNIEYVDFENIKAQDCIFPFHTICSAYGLLSQLTEFGNNKIFSAYSETLSIQEYKKLLPDFQKYYCKNEKYFPLTNIYIATNELDLAYESIMAGIIRTIQVRDFRSLKYFCKLVYLNNIFSVKQRRFLYENINKWISTEQFSLAEYHDYQLSASMIRDLLLNEDSKKPTLIFYLETNINPYEMEKQVAFLT
ncbi:pentapeptide repeat-containing protein [Faecalicatena contorta]|uniref:Pentapeptide repeat-containing protein n=1 Tax=Faecalicatena contorta TaxID=39482 RepID=A0A316A022_9FIRM|nr:pentapeptide repeat-containing protein [Faecalicatena contorta]PWJ50490.1 pentapeptide repeat protein [Faecalicatena contorta]SUQ13898.1 Pentapeptide repeat-containing protein [Faecalicatena contorta]